MTGPASEHWDYFPDEPEQCGSLVPLEVPLLTALQRFAPEQSSAQNGILIARYRTFVVKVNDAIVVK